MSLLKMEVDEDLHPDDPTTSVDRKEKTNHDDVKESICNRVENENCSDVNCTESEANGKLEKQKGHKVQDKRAVHTDKERKDVQPIKTISIDEQDSDSCLEYCNTNVDIGFADTCSFGATNLAETIHNAHAAVLDENANLKSAMNYQDWGSDCARVGNHDINNCSEPEQSISDRTVEHEDRDTNYDKNNNVEISIHLTDLTNPSTFVTVESKLNQEKRKTHDNKAMCDSVNLKPGNIDRPQFTVREDDPPKSGDVVPKDLNNNITARSDGAYTPDCDRGISPEIFCLTHMSPTTLYGDDTPAVMYRHTHRSLSRAESTLNTPELPCDDSFDQRDTVNPLLSSSISSCGQMKRKLSYPQEQVENPFYSGSFPSDPKYSRSSHTSNPHCVYNAYMQQDFSQNVEYRGNEYYLPFTQSSCGYPDWNANQIMSTTNTGYKSHARCRLDFHSPVDLSCQQNIESPVDFNSFDVNRTYDITSTSMPRFVANPACLSANLTRPTPIVPTASSYQHYPGLNMGYGPSSSLQISSCNFMPVQNQLFSYSRHSYPQSDIHVASAIPVYQYQQQQQYSSLHTASVQSRRTATATCTYSSHCDTYSSDINGNVCGQIDYTCSSSPFPNRSYQDAFQSERSESPMYVAIPLDRINNNAETDTGKSTETVNGAYEDSSSENLPSESELVCVTDSCDDTVEQDSISDVSKEIISHTKPQEEKADNSHACSPKTIRDIVVPIKIKNKEVAISVSELSNKTVKELLEKVKGTDIDEDDSSVETNRKKPMLCNKTFITAYEKERKANSPLSAFCAALQKTKQPENRSILPAIAEPRIPIQTLLKPNEVPMMRSGSMLVPYFNPSLPHTFNNTQQPSTIASHSQYRNISNVRVPVPESPWPPTGLPANMAIPLYDNSVNSSNQWQHAVPAQQPVIILPKTSQSDGVTIPHAVKTQTTPTPIMNVVLPQRSIHRTLTSQTARHLAPSTQSRSITKSPKAKTFKAKHYSFTMLRIGTYVYTCNLQSNDRGARTKFLFSKRQLIYEYQLDSSSSSIVSEKAMVEVVIPFHTICQIAMDDNEMKLELTHAPAMYRGIRRLLKNGSRCVYNQSAIYNRRKIVDETGGQLTKCPYHCLLFKTSCISNIQSDLVAFHPMFKDMLQRPFEHHTFKTYSGLETSIRSSLLHPDITLPSEPSRSRAFTEFTSRLRHNQEFPIIQCSCIEDCSRTGECRCCMAGMKCTPGWCKCSKCQNPYSILTSLGVSIEEVITDQCLMDNIFQLICLMNYLKTPLRLECCGGSTLLYKCIPGLVTCPTPNCNHKLKYSWCTAKLCNESISPRNHCEHCKRCTDRGNVHCQKCSSCYFAGDYGVFKCPTCITTAEDEADDDDDDDDYDDDTTTEFSTDSTTE